MEIFKQQMKTLNGSKFTEKMASGQTSPSLQLAMARGHNGARNEQEREHEDARRKGYQGPTLPAVHDHMHTSILDTGKSFWPTVLQNCLAKGWSLRSLTCQAASRNLTLSHFGTSAIV